MSNILFEDFPKICRLCLGFGTLQPIIKIKDLQILNTITNINVSFVDDYHLPQFENNILKTLIAG